MHTPPGCFGSMIAYDHAAPMCQSCTSHVECQARVDVLRPKIISILDRFSDGSGREMSYAWLTKGERKARKKAQMDDSLISQSLQAPEDIRNGAKAKRAVRREIDPRTCDRAELAGLSRHMTAVIECASRAPATHADIAAAVQERSNLSIRYAERVAYQEVSFLISVGRARYAGPHLELI